MTPITVDELPDYLSGEFPDVNFSCIADFTRDGIAIQCQGAEIAFFTEDAFEDGKVTKETIQKHCSDWLSQKRSM